MIVAELSTLTVALVTQENEYSMTYMAWNDARDLDLPSISLYNRAGNYVRPSLATINSALSDYQNSSTFVVDISDGPGARRHPMSFARF